MNQIKCPHCGKEFTVDETSYNSIVQQIRDHVFNEELNKRLNSEVELALEKEKMTSLKKTSELEAQISTLQSEIENMSNAAELDKKNAVEEYAQKLTEAVVESNKLRQELEDSTNRKDMEIDKAISEERLRSQNEINKYKNELTELQGKYSTSIAEANLKMDRAVQEEKNKYAQMRQEYETQIATNEANYQASLKMVNDELDRVKEHKLALTTKGVGEDLEQYCKMKFDEIRMSAYRTATFEKDNDISEKTKGDFIFRDYKDGIEYVSIMFEMKNESDATGKKQTNESFFKKLDEDRKKKNCDYAVLVSMLEQDNDYYNQGIVEVYQYPKMYVVRPNMFLNIISLIRNSSLDIVDTKVQLENARQTNLDVNSFKANVEKIINTVQTHNKNANAQFEKTVEFIDKTIDNLQNAKDALLKVGGHLLKEENKLLELQDVKTLTKNTPKVAQMFAATEEGNVIDG